MGSVCGLIGPNGAGKSTALRLLVDLTRPTSGTVRVFGQDPTRAPAALRRRIGYLPGDFIWSTRASAGSVIDFLGALSGDYEAAYVAQLAERLDLDLDARMRTLSTGTRQKVGLIQAFMHRPQLLILDEPTSGLDPLMQREFLALVDEARAAGQTVLLSSHILSEVQHVADTATVLAKGRAVWSGPTRQLRAGAHARVRAHIRARDRETVASALSSCGLAEADIRGRGHVSVSARLAGDVDPLIKALARLDVVDLTIEEADLESVIVQMYDAQRRK